MDSKSQNVLGKYEVGNKYNNPGNDLFYHSWMINYFWLSDGDVGTKTNIISFFYLN